MTTARPGDSAMSHALGVAGLVLVCCWSLTAGALVLTRIVLAGQATPPLEDAYASVLVSAVLLSFLLWLGSYAALGVGVAVSVAALVVGGRIRRALAFSVLVSLCAATQFVLESLRNTATWDLHPDRLAVVVATTGTIVAPLAGLVVALVLLAPVVRRPRSTPEPAAAG
jgi:hypothetical protein